MKKMKKIFALLLALAMVLGMGLTSMAAVNDTAVITVKNIVTDADKDNTVLSVVQVIAPDETTETGWKFVNGAADEFTTALGTNGTNAEQDAIWKLIWAATPSLTPEGEEAASAEDINTALKNVTGHKSEDFVSDDKVENINYSDNKGEITVTSAGVYAINARETGYTYNPMAAYIEFGYTGGVPTEIKNPEEINAKKIDLNIDKTNSEEQTTEGDKVVAIGDEITYTITTSVPYIATNVEKVVYTITDTITGAEYVLNDDEKLEVTVTVNDVAVENNPYKVGVSATDNGQTFTIDLSDIAVDRTKANLSLVLTYKAKVTGEVVNNSAVPNDGEHQFTPATDVLYTGSLEMVKYGENNVVLSGAQFVVYKEVSGTKQYAIFELKEGKLVLKSWTTEKDDAKNVENANKVVTDSNGKVRVYGLDDSVTYYFEEVVAPEGYSINTEPSEAIWDTDSPVTAKVGNADMTDTILNALPSTGGIGTTIFTVAGCGIMIAAAFFFFASRKKENN